MKTRTCILIVIFMLAAVCHSFSQARTDATMFYHAPEKNESGYSTDGGRTWLFVRAQPRNYPLQNSAIVGFKDGVPSISNDSGRTWQPIQRDGENLLGLNRSLKSIALPGDGVLKLLINDDCDQLLITDIRGSVIRSQRIQSRSGDIQNVDLSQYSSGVYIVTVFSALAQSYHSVMVTK